jgi:hypothetical protein
MITMTIDHVPNVINVRAALTERDVQTRATQRVETHDATVISSVSQAVRSTRETRSDRDVDLRYLIVFRDARGSMTRIYLDAFGLRGVVDGRPVRFANDAIKRAIVRAFPQLAQ